MKSKKIGVTKNGPYIISGNIPVSKETIVADKEGYSVKWKKGKKYPIKETCALCRCGHSKNKPYCDGSHIKANFNGTETASKKKYADCCEKFYGKELTLTDYPELCSLARFCHNKKGSVWDLVESSKLKDLAIKEACNCPSGRLVIWNKGKKIEPKFKKSISLIEDPEKGVSGPIWVKGGIQITSADGKNYEKRNRVTLCRCGKSKNKPFCDGTHTIERNKR